jgi:hypothetical protein
MYIRTTDNKIILATVPDYGTYILLKYGITIPKKNIWRQYRDENEKKPVQIKRLQLK